MALPKITHPVFKITIPSTKKTYGFRPYTVKEEKLLLFLKNNDNISEVLDTIKQIINNCCVEEIDISKLSLFDIEYIFIKLRSQSVGSIIELVYRKGEQ
ncbi:MAG: baseplate protein, partial [Terrimicrobiaceae bacterium]